MIDLRHEANASSYKAQELPLLSTTNTKKSGWDSIITLRVGRECGPLCRLTWGGANIKLTRLGGREMHTGWHGSWLLVVLRGCRERDSGIVICQFTKESWPLSHLWLLGQESLPIGLPNMGLRHQAWCPSEHREIP
jgi:hypothetical protein